jgi:hypothetical protein
LYQRGAVATTARRARGDADAPRQLARARFRALRRAHHEVQGDAGRLQRQMGGRRLFGIELAAIAS